MPAAVHIPPGLRSHTNGRSVVQAEGDTVALVLDHLEAAWPGLRRQLVDEHGALRRYQNIYVNEKDVRFLKGLGTVVRNGDEVLLVPAAAGG